MTTTTSAADAALFEVIPPQHMRDYRIMNTQGDSNRIYVDPGIVGDYGVYAIVLQDRTKVEFRYGMRFFPTLGAIEAWIAHINEGGGDFAYVEMDGLPDSSADNATWIAIIRDCWSRHTAMEAPIP